MLSKSCKITEDSSDGVFHRREYTIFGAPRKLRIVRYSCTVETILTILGIFKAFRCNFELLIPILQFLTLLSFFLFFNLISFMESFVVTVSPGSLLTFSFDGNHPYVRMLLKDDTKNLLVQHLLK